MLSLKNYAAQRDDLLRQIMVTLQKDGRFTAAWLGGSFGRNEGHDDSDLDLFVVTTDEGLLARPSLPRHQLPPARQTLFRQFGELGLVFEAHQNAPTGGTMTTVFYADTAVCVDWVLLPVEGTIRPLPSQLLFEKTTIPIQPPAEAESLDERIKQAEHDIAYFWLMTAIIPKYIIRAETFLCNSWLNILHEVLHNVARLVEGRPWQYRSGANITLKLSQAEQVTAVRHICAQMEGLMTAVMKMGGSVPPKPMQIIDKRLALIEQD